MQITRLTLNNWPPLASHLCALIFGIILANMSADGTKPSWRVRPGWAIVRVAADQIFVQNVTRSQADVVLVAVDESHVPRCRLLDGALVQADYDHGPILLLPLTKAAELAVMLRQSSKVFSGPGLFEVDAPEVVSLLPCARGGRVRFGADKA